MHDLLVHDTQVLIRFGELPEEEFENIQQRNGGTLAAWLDPDKMKPLKPQQVAWWDETHRKCIVIGGQRAAGATHCVRFPRTPEGKLDLEAGKDNDSKLAWVNVKYEKWVRLCLGCGIYEEADGTTVGVGLSLKLTKVICKITLFSTHILYVV
jgi:hypothetical protein